jgi:MFS family permease
VVVDALDTTLLFLQEGGGATIFFVAGLLALLPAAWVARRRGLARRHMAAAVLTGLLFAALDGLYILARLQRLTITSKPVHFHPASLAATFLLAGSGALLYLGARSWRGRGVGVLVAALGSFGPAAGLLGLFGLANRVFTVPRLGVPIWNHHLGLQPLIAFVVEAALFALAFAVMARVVQTKPKEATNV